MTASQKPQDGGAAFAPHADVRIVIAEIYKLEAALNAAGLNAPALTEARDMLTRLSWQVYQAQGSQP